MTEKKFDKIGEPPPPPPKIGTKKAYVMRFRGAIHTRDDLTRAYTKTGSLRPLGGK